MPLPVTPVYDSWKRAWYSYTDENGVDSLVFMRVANASALFMTPVPMKPKSRALFNGLHRKVIIVPLPIAETALSPRKVIIDSVFNAAWNGAATIVGPIDGVFWQIVCRLGERPYV